MSTQRKQYSAEFKARVALEALKGQGFQHVWRRCRAQSLCGRITKLSPSTGYENDGHGATFWQLVQQ
jgi:transposase-like protein